MGKYVPTCDEEFEFNELLRRVDAPADLNDCAAINTFVRAKLKIHQLWVAERVGWHVLNQIVGGEDEGSPKPLLAARVLLGFYEYPSDPTVPIRPDGPPLREYFTSAPTLSGPPKQRRIIGLTVRQKIATVEGGFGKSNEFSGNLKKLPIVSAALWLAFEEYILGLSEQQARRLIKEARASGPSGGTVRVVKEKRSHRQAPSSSTSEPPKPASRKFSIPSRLHFPRWVTKKIVVSLAVLLALLSIGAAATVKIFPPESSPSSSPSILLVPDSSQPLAKTEVVTFMPTLSEIIAATGDADELSDAACAPSFSSIRRDALSCAVDMDVRRFLDPCFLVADDRISCPNAMDLLLGTGIVSNQAKLTAHIDAVWSSSEGRVGIDNAENAAGPWIFLLDKTVGDGLPLTCRAALVATVEFDGPAYNCAIANKFPEIFPDPSNEIFSSASYIGVGYLNQIVAGDLDRSTEPWTVEVVDPTRNTTERVAVRKAWF